MATVMNRRTEEVTIDVINLILGIGLALTPWMFAYLGESTATWNAWIVGALMALVALGALVQFAEWEEWANLVLGIWALAAPWLLGFSGVIDAMYSHVVVGVLVAILAAIELWLVHKRPFSTI